MTDLVLAVEHDDALNHALEAEVAEARETIKHQACRKRCGVAKPNHPLGRATGYEHAFVVEAATLCQQLLDAAQGVDNDRGRNREELQSFAKGTSGMTRASQSRHPPQHSSRAHCGCSVRPRSCST